MDKLINNRRARGIHGAVVVTGLAAGAVLLVSGRSSVDRTATGARGGTAIARVSEGRDKPAGRSAGSVAGAFKPPLGVLGAGNALAGERRYLQTCSACHGAGGMGQPHMGANLRDSRFVREQTDDALVAFVKAGRPLGDPKSVLGLSMPALGGNPTLEDRQIRDIVAFLRTFQARAERRAPRRA